MFRRGRVRPSRSSSIVGMIVGIMLLVIGFTTGLSMAGLFGVFWTLIGVIITGGHAYNAFSGKGFADYEVDIEVADPYQVKQESFDEKLRKLEALKNDKLITEEEYEAKRQEILNDKW